MISNRNDLTAVELHLELNDNDLTQNDSCDGLPEP
jgi:hypothetical protein